MGTEKRLGGERRRRRRRRRRREKKKREKERERERRRTGRKRNHESEGGSACKKNKVWNTDREKARIKLHFIVEVLNLSYKVTKRKKYNTIQYNAIQYNTIGKEQ